MNAKSSTPEMAFADALHSFTAGHAAHADLLAHVSADSDADVDDAMQGGHQPSIAVGDLLSCRYRLLEDAAGTARQPAVHKNAAAVYALD